MDRRQFLVAVPCGALLPSLASAQEPGRVYRMAVISPSEAAVEMVRNLQLPELARLGFIVGRNLTLTTHVGPPALMPELARQAIATKPDVIVAVSTVAILAVKEASSTVPIVMSFIARTPSKREWPTASPGPVAARPASRCWQPRWTGSVRRCCMSLCRRRAVSRSLPAARLAMQKAPR